MVKPRIIETSEGIQGEFDVKNYDIMQRHFRDKGWMETKRIIDSGICSGTVLEIGPGPGYLGLEWLKSTQHTTLKGIEISQEMITIALKNADEYGLTQRVKYIQGDALKLPFEDNAFNAVFSNGSLHEWEDPIIIFNEIDRVLKSGGRYFISDLRRDINPLMRWAMFVMTKPKEIRPGLITSLNASYTLEELLTMLNNTQLNKAQVEKNIMGLEITGKKSI